MGEDKIYSPTDVRQMAKALMKDQLNYHLITHRFSLIDGFPITINFANEQACETAKYLLLNRGWNVDYKSSTVLLVTIH